MTKVKFVIKVKGQPSSKKKLRNKELWKRAVAHFNFDHVLDPTTKNWNVYEVIAPIVQSFKDGYNGTILAYGQALSGKTYTMMGTAADPGVKVLAIRQLMCERIFSSTRCFIIRVGYMEILNEVVFDLLNQRELVYFCQRSKNKIEHTNREIFVKDEASILQLLDEGNKQLAPKSSSSTVFQIIIESQDEAIEDEPVRLSYLNLVELNDSEGLLTKTTSRNKSIECLKLAFEALSDGKPFENCSESKLTTLLASTCMGNANIAIICNIVPTVLDQTYNLLSFVDKFRNVETPLCDYTDYSILTKLQCRIEQLIENGAEENSDEIEKLKSVFLTEEDMRDDAGSCKIFKEVLPLFSESHNKLDCKYHIIKMVPSSKTENKIGSDFYLERCGFDLNCNNTYYLKNGNNIIGRYDNSDADLRVQSENCSRMQCSIMVSDTFISLTDLYSTNGTMVNETLVTGQTIELHVNDLIDVTGYETDLTEREDFQVMYRLCTSASTDTRVAPSKGVSPSDVMSLSLYQSMEECSSTELQHENTSSIINYALDNFSFSEVDGDNANSIQNDKKGDHAAHTYQRNVNQLVADEALQSEIESFTVRLNKFEEFVSYFEEK